MKLTILGAGAMGSALSFPAADNGQEVVLWGTDKDADIIRTVRRGGAHPRLGVKLPSSVKFSLDSDLGFLRKSDIVVVAVSSNVFCDILQKALPHVRKDAYVVNVAKGLYCGESNICTYSGWLGNACLETTPTPRGFVSVGGPSLAGELARRSVTTAVFAAEDIRAAEYCRSVFATPYYLVHTTDDVVGVEVCAAVKNVYAIAIGFCGGLQEAAGGSRGENIRAAVFPYAVREMERLVDACGGRKETVNGLAGIGDLLVTSQGGRNEMFGRLVGSGKSPEEALSALDAKGVIEGYETAHAAHYFVKALEVRSTKFTVLRDTPLLGVVHSLLHKGMSSRTALARILNIISRGVQ